MSFAELVARHALDIHGVLHVGANLAQEAEDYHSAGVGPVAWVEANPAVLDQILANIAGYPEQRLIDALVYSEDDIELRFNITNHQGMSSSIYEFGTHPQFSPDTVFVEHLTLRTRTIDTLVAEFGIVANMLSMDIQGAELHALRGATKFLENVDYILTEVNRAQVYIGCAQVEEIEAFLPEFSIVAAHWVEGQDWGDALMVRRCL